MILIIKLLLLAFSFSHFFSFSLSAFRYQKSFRFFLKTFIFSINFQPWSSGVLNLFSLLLCIRLPHCPCLQRQGDVGVGTKFGKVIGNIFGQFFDDLSKRPVGRNVSKFLWKIVSVHAHGPHCVKPGIHLSKSKNKPRGALCLGADLVNKKLNYTTCSGYEHGAAPHCTLAIHARLFAHFDEPTAFDHGVHGLLIVIRNT